MSRRIKPVLIGMLCICFVLSIGALAFAQVTDIKGHWAEKQITEWVDNGFIKGYSDGTFKPDQGITRAEFMTLTNKAFGFTEVSASVYYSDVKSSDWFAGEIAKAGAAGYISGYEDGTIRPNNNITRQEVAAIITKALKANAADNVSEINKFKDAKAIPEWSKGFVGTVTKLGYMGGYPDGTFQPAKFITKAEAVVTLSHKNAPQQPAAQSSFDKAGTYGPETGTDTINGNAVINAAGVTLRNTVITGDLLLGAGIGEGDVTLKNVTVKGKTTVKGGGSNSVKLEDCNMPTIVVDKEGVRVVASGNTTVNVITLESGATLVEVTITGPGFETVTISETVPADTPITLTGDFETVNVDAAVDIEIASGTVDELNVDAAAQITGDATIVNASITVAGVTIEQTPTTTEVEDGLTADVGGSIVSGTTTTTTTTGGGGGGGTTTTAVTATAIAASLSTGAVQGVLADNKLSATINLSGAAGTATFTGISITAPANSTMSSISVTSPVIGSMNISRTISGIDNISVADLTGIGAGGVTMDLVRSLLGSSVTITGQLACTGYSSSSVSLTINLGVANGPYVNQWVDVSTSGNDYTATVKSGMGTTTIVSIGLVNFLMETAGQIPSAVYFVDQWYDPNNLVEKSNLAADIATAVGKSWNQVTLDDVKVLDFKFKKIGYDTEYNLFIQ